MGTYWSLESLQHDTLICLWDSTAFEQLFLLINEALQSNKYPRSYAYWGLRYFSTIFGKSNYVGMQYNCTCTNIIMVN